MGKLILKHLHLNPSRIKRIEALPIWKTDGDRNDLSVSAKIRYARKENYFAASAGGAVQIVWPKARGHA